MTDIFFYCLALLLVIFSVLVTMVPNLLHSALSLIASFFITAALYLLFNMEFVALSQIMIYLGGIVIFCIIIILLTTGLGDENLFKTRHSTKIIGGIMSSFLLFILLNLSSKSPELRSLSNQRPLDAGSMDQIGLRLLSTEQSGFMIPFELISILLLISVIGAIVLARKERELNKE